MYSIYDVHGVFDKVWVLERVVCMQGVVGWCQPYPTFKCGSNSVSVVRSVRCVPVEDGSISPAESEQIAFEEVEQAPGEAHRREAEG